MATLTKVTPSLCSLDVPPHCHMTLPASTALAAGDMVYIKSDGTFALCDGTALDVKSDWWGMVNRACAAGSPVTAYHSVQFQYASGLTPGAPYYASATAGALSDAATTGGSTRCAMAVDAKTIFVLPPRSRS